MTKLCLKLVCSPTGEVRRVPLTLSFSELHGKIIPSLFAGTLGPIGDVLVQYKDDEGDMITISSNPELADAVELARDLGLRSLRLTLRPSACITPPEPCTLRSAIKHGQPSRFTTRPTANSLYVHDAVARGAAAAARARAGASRAQLLSEITTGKALRRTTPRVRQRPVVLVCPTATATNPLANAAAAAAAIRAGSFSAAAEGVDLRQALKAQAQRTAARAAAGATVTQSVAPQIKGNAADQDGQTLEQAIQATIDAYAARHQQQQVIARTDFAADPQLPAHAVHLATARAAAAAAQGRKAEKDDAAAAPPAEAAMVPTQRHAQLAELASMGFENQMTNAALLESYQGRLDQVVNALLAGA